MKDGKKEKIDAEPRDLLSIREFCFALSIGKTTAYKMITERAVTPIHLYGRVLIPRSEKDNFIAKRLTDAKNRDEPLP